MTYTEITEALREAKREEQQSRVFFFFFFLNQVEVVYLYDSTLTRLRPELEIKTRNPTQIFLEPPKTC